jgi:hypothetical protein
LPCALIDCYGAGFTNAGKVWKACDGGLLQTMNLIISFSSNSARNSWKENPIPAAGLCRFVLSDQHRRDEECC